MSEFACWFALMLPEAGPCDGQLVRCHLISKDRLKKEFPLGATWQGERWVAVRRLTATLTTEPTVRYRPLALLQSDPRAWVAGCGGLTGIGGHHGKFDTAPHDSTRLRIPRELIPPETEQFALELGFEGWMDRTYGSP